MDKKEKGMMFYQSTVKGITQTVVDGPIVYYGFSFRHARLDNEPNLELEREMIERVHDLLDGDGLKERKNAAFVVNGTLERYEVFDVDSDDMLIMYRIPCCYHGDVITSPKVNRVELVCHPTPYPQSLMDRVTDLDDKELLALRIIIDTLLAGRAGGER